MSGYGRIRRGRMAADIFGKHFTQIFNLALRDARLSRKARGFLAELLTHQEGFGISVAALVAGGPEGKDAVLSGLRELEKYGYLTRSDPQHDEKGRFTHIDYEVNDTPEGMPGLAKLFGLEESPRSEPLAENPATGEDEENRRSEPLAGYPAADEPATGDPETGNPPHKKTTFEEDQVVVPRTRATSSKKKGKAPAAPEGEGAASQKDNPASGRKPSVPAQGRAPQSPAGGEPTESPAQATEDGTQAHSASGEAVELLASIEGDLALNSRQVAELAPLLTEMAAECGWPIGRELKHELTRPRQGSPVKYPHKVLKHRIEELKPNRAKARPQPKAPVANGEAVEMCHTHPHIPKAACLCWTAGEPEVSDTKPVSSREEALARIREMTHGTSRPARAGKR